jgi:thioredoxin-related protein/response regulator of citrate/malate metabolism
MKSLFTAICLFIITASVSAAEITFLDNPTWASVLEKAKKENKMIFLDGYATWCGPCKNMDSETYKNQAVADYYNANFINVKYDMEKGEGKTLAEKHDVRAYPNLMFINTEGVMLHKGVGFLEAKEFVDLGKNAKDPNIQYYTLKKKALELSNAQFLKFAEQAVAFEDEDFDDLGSQYLAKQADILGNADLIDLVMVYISVLPDEKSLAYFKANKEKVIKAGKFTTADHDERIIGLTMAYGLSAEIQTDQENLDFDALDKILEKYVPEKAFFVGHYFRAQYQMDNKEFDKAETELNKLLDNTPEKVTFDQVCNALMNMGPELAKQNKLEPLLKKLEAIKLSAKDADKTYMKDFVKVIIYIKAKELDKFKALANTMILDANTPQNVKEDLKNALTKMN